MHSMSRIVLRRTTAVWIAASAALAVAPAMAADGGIPARPDELKYPGLSYEAPKAATYRAKLKNGMVAYLVPDRSLPLVSVNVIMRLGGDMDPAGKEGLASLTTYLLTRSGTKTRTAQALEDRVAALGAQLESSIGGGGANPFAPSLLTPAEGSVSINLLSKDIDEGLAILTECLTSPAWEADRLKLRKDQVMADMKQRNDDSTPIEEREWSFLMRGDGHWTNRYSTAASVAAITADDLSAFQKKYIGPKNFTLAVSGDFDRSAMVSKLEKAFAKWPTPGERPAAPPAPTATSTPGWYLVDKDVNQGRVSIGRIALDRYDPDYVPALVMNDILGGGGFSSRLVNRIRSDEGLAYSVRSVIQGGTYYADPWRAQFQSKVRSVAFATQIAMEEIKKMKDTDVSAEELEVSKNKFIEAFPTQFETAGQIAQVLALEDVTGRAKRDPNYLSEFRDRVRKVQAADVKRVAQRVLDPSKMTVLMVGNAQDILLGDPKHPVTVAQLAGGEPKRIPLRDPMTMQPMPHP
jgi:zinc protease